MHIIVPTQVRVSLVAVSRTIAYAPRCGRTARRRYNHVIRSVVKTAISLPESTFARVIDAALDDRIGALPQWLMAQVDAGLQRALGLPRR